MRWIILPETHESDLDPPAIFTSILGTPFQNFEKQGLFSEGIPQKNKEKNSGNPIGKSGKFLDL
ncbi:hypothetical protein [Methanoregula sp. UBA64]|jgi:hypothetical protein|uniref:hypothetical protein n=1 Tax=Methanoregula sp. UBA64 TaxID=1915554 RepID=UPI0025E5DDD2|nr:hypothetical protein [Methanoregula sp. UBA64]